MLPTPCPSTQTDGTDGVLGPRAKLQFLTYLHSPCTSPCTFWNLPIPSWSSVQPCGMEESFYETKIMKRSTEELITVTKAKNIWHCLSYYWYFCLATFSGGARVASLAPPRFPPFCRKGFKGLFLASLMCSQNRYFDFVVSFYDWFDGQLAMPTFQSYLAFFFTLLHIPLISRVRGPYGKLWTEFFPSFYGPSAKRAGHKNKEGKNEDP